MRVKIRWDLIDRGQPQIVEEGDQVATFVKVFECLCQKLGHSILQRFTGWSVSRAPLGLVSKDRGTFGDYSHKQIGDSDWYVITNNNKVEKMGILCQVPRRLGYPYGRD
jgi:hypothetical protein